MVTESFLVAMPEQVCNQPNYSKCYGKYQNHETKRFSLIIELKYFKNDADAHNELKIRVKLCYFIESCLVINFGFSLIFWHQREIAIGEVFSHD